MMRANLPPLPARMQKLPLDARGYPVPFFVEWVEGKPDFRIVDPNKWQSCVQFSRCWICGERLGRWQTFVLGPKSAEKKLTSEPPSHKECAEFAVRACPFIVLPSAKHRPIPEHGRVIPTVEASNPGRYCLWTTDHFELVTAGEHGTLISIWPAKEQVWYVGGNVVAI